MSHVTSNPCFKVEPRQKKKVLLPGCFLRTLEHVLINEVEFYGLKNHERKHCITMKPPRSWERERGLPEICLNLILSRDPYFMSVEEHVHYKTTKIHNANAISCLNFIDPKNVEFVFHHPPNVITLFLRLQERHLSVLSMSNTPPSGGRAGLLKTDE